MKNKSTAVPKMACKHCIWWNDKNRSRGECHFGPPKLPAVGESGTIANMFRDGIWPETNPNTFCGEYEYRGTPSDLP